MSAATNWEDVYRTHTARIAELERENAALRERVDVWKGEALEHGTELHTLERENAALRNKLAVLERDYAALDDRYERLVEKEAQP